RLLAPPPPRPCAVPPHLERATKGMGPFFPSGMVVALPWCMFDVSNFTKGFTMQSRISTTSRPCRWIPLSAVAVACTAMLGCDDTADAIDDRAAREAEEARQELSDMKQEAAEKKREAERQAQELKSETKEAARDVKEGVVEGAEKVSD